jgi:trehalose 6-phosphate synthase
MESQGLPPNTLGQPGIIDAEQTLQDRPLIIASNRGPMTFTHEGNDRFSSRRGSGGVVTAVASIAKSQQPIWVACAMGPGDRQRAEVAKQRGETLISPPGDAPEFRLRFVVPTEAAYHGYYNVISNPLLWFLQHYLWDTPRSPDITHETWEAWDDGYVAVNRLFADEILDIMDGLDAEPIIMLQDYHLYLTAGFIRATRPDAILQHFVHIPWPDPDYWRLLPFKIRRQILQGMLGNDVIGFQTRDHARSFMYTCESYIPGVQIDYSGRGIIWEGRRIEIRDYPISIDVESVRKLAYGQESRSHDRYLPELLQRVQHPPGRPGRAEQEHHPRLRGLRPLPRGPPRVPRPGQLHGDPRARPGWTSRSTWTTSTTSAPSSVGSTPATPTLRPAGSRSHDPRRELPPRPRAMKWYDVLLVNSIIDGMNLVAKEGVLLNERNGVLLLSEGAGAAMQLGEDAIMISPPTSRAPPRPSTPP